MDTWLFYLVNHGMRNDFFDWFMPFITKYRDWIPLGIVIFGYQIWKDRKRGLLLLAVTIVAVTFSDFISSRILKNLFARPRPCITLHDVRLLTGCSSSGSFPSSHAANSFTIASILGFYDRRFWIVSIPAASLVALSRIYLGVHYPLDVTFAATMGIAIGWLSIRLSRLNSEKRTIKQ